MEHPIQSAIAFFGKKYERILLLILFIQLPIIAVQFFASNYILAITPAEGSLFNIADIYNAFIIITFFVFAMVPFVYFWHYEETGIDKPLRQAFLQFTLKSFHFFVFSALFGFVVTIGVLFFVLPGLILFAMLISAPVIAAMDNQSVWVSIRESIRIFKAQHWKIVSLAIAFGMVELIASYIMQMFITDITTSFLAIAICHVFLNTIFLPLFYLILASLITKWREDLSLLSIDKKELLASE